MWGVEIHHVSSLPSIQECSFGYQVYRPSQFEEFALSRPSQWPHSAGWWGHGPFVTEHVVTGVLLRRCPNNNDRTNFRKITPEATELQAIQGYHENRSAHFPLSTTPRKPTSSIAEVAVKFELLPFSWRSPPQQFHKENPEARRRPTTITWIGLKLRNLIASTHAASEF